MNRYMVKIEVGGEWHRFVMSAIHAHAAFVKLADLGVPDEAHYGIRAAKEDEPTNEPTKADIDRLASLGWTYTTR